MFPKSASKEEVDILTSPNVKTILDEENKKDAIREQEEAERKAKERFDKYYSRDPMAQVNILHNYLKNYKFSTDPTQHSLMSTIISGEVNRFYESHKDNMDYFVYYWSTCSDGCCNNKLRPEEECYDRILAFPMLHFKKCSFCSEFFEDKYTKQDYLENHVRNCLEALWRGE